MTIGEALKKERERLNLSQKEMAGEILSRSQYGKVEKNQHDISAQKLIELIDYHQIDIAKFMRKISDHDSNERNIISLFKKLREAFFENDLFTVRKLSSIIHKLPGAEELKVSADLVQATMENKISELGNDFRNKIQKYMFSDETWTNNTIALAVFGNSMMLFDKEYLDLYMSQLLRKYQNINCLQIIDQERICTICGNYLLNTYKNPNYKIFYETIKLVNSTSAHPALWEYKIINLYFKAYVEGNKEKQKFIINLLEETHETRLLNLLLT